MRIKYIDVLKAVAITAVVLYHAGLMSYGYLGVDLFLVIAGYLTTKSLSKKVLNTEESRCGYMRFELSRINRLLPLLLLAGFACMIAGYFTMLPDDYENLSQSVIASNFFGNNILATITTSNYWDITNEFKPLMHTWYVGLLMQFYLVYPVLFYLAKLNKQNPKGTLLTMVASLAFISLLTYFATPRAAYRFYLLPSRFFEFAVGGIAALVYNPDQHKPFGKGFVYVCYVLLLALLFINVKLIPGSIRLVAVAGLSCVLLCSQNVLENKLSGNAILVSIGAASYSIFIWHQIVLAFCRYRFTSNFTVGCYILLLALTVLLAWLSYSFIEKASEEALKTKRGKTIFYTMMLAAFLGLTAFAGMIYMRAGVVRDIPELNVSKDDIHHGDSRGLLNEEGEDEVKTSTTGLDERMTRGAGREERNKNMLDV